jgi:hypothetical protein
VLDYLGRYTHRVAIANRRRIGLAGGQVCFRWKDYRHPQRPKVMTLPAGEFIRRFLPHVLPDGFRRIRHFGFLANAHRSAKLALIRGLLDLPAPERAPEPADYRTHQPDRLLGPEGAAITKRISSTVVGMNRVILRLNAYRSSCGGSEQRGATMANVRGSCLCGGVKLEIIGPLMRVLNCHCSKCRQQHGAAFRSRARVRIEDFKLLQGEELVRFYQSSPGFYRGFCGACGSPLITKSSHPEFGVPLGILDDDPNVRPTLHCFVASKAPWFDITDNSSSISGATRLLLKTAADRVWPRSSAPRLGTRCCAVSRPEFRALDLTLDQTQDYRRRRKCAYSWASLERRSKQWRGCSQ